MKKQLIVITGASSGIGEATAKYFSEMGHPLLLLARRIDRLNDLKLPEAMCREVDITDLEGFRQTLHSAEQQYGPCDCLINNAGVMLLGQADSQAVAEWKTMFDVNVLGLLNGIHLILEGMKKRGTGTVINISSIAGRKTFPNHAVYCGTKFAVHAITENIREEVAGDNIRFITIAPGAVETELLSHTSSAEIKAGYESWKQDMGGVLVAGDIARSIAFAYNQPQNVCIREIVIAATRQGP